MKLLVLVVALCAVNMTLMGCGLFANNTSGDVPASQSATSSTPAPTPIQAQVIATNTTQPEEATHPDVVAIVNGQAIRRADYDQQVAQARMMYIDQAGLAPDSEAAQELLLQLRQQVRDSMIDQLLLQQTAVEWNIRVTETQLDDEVARMKGQDSTRFEEWLQQNGLSETSLRDRLASDLLSAAIRDAITAELSHQQLHIHARYIFNTDHATTLEALTKVRGGADFGAVARQYSLDETTRASGGDLGFIPQGVMPSAFDQAAFSMQSDQISDIVTLDAGYIIIQVLEVDPARSVSEDNWPLVQQYAFESWLAEQRAQAEIMYNPVFD